MRPAPIGRHKNKIQIQPMGGNFRGGGLHRGVPTARHSASSSPRLSHPPTLGKTMGWGPRQRPQRPAPRDWGRKTAKITVGLI